MLRATRTERNVVEMESRRGSRPTRFLVAFGKTCPRSAAPPRRHRGSLAREIGLVLLVMGVMRVPIRLQLLPRHWPSLKGQTAHAVDHVERRPSLGAEELARALEAAPTFEASQEEAAFRAAQPAGISAW